MMKHLKWIAAAGLLVASGVANAQFSSTITATNDYDFRGFSQSAKDPAIQASVDYAFSNGFAIGAWASNVDFDPFDGNVELDLYGSYTGKFNDDASWSLGFVYYAYPGSSSTTVDLGAGPEELAPLGEYPEYFVGFGYKQFGFKQWYADDLYESGESAQYTEANATFPLPNNFSLLAHVGYAWGDYWKDSELFDYSIGVGYTYEKFNFALKFNGTDASGDDKITGDVGNNEGRLVFSVATTLPW